MTGADIEGTPSPEEDPERQLVRVLVAAALVTEFVALTSSNPAEAMAAGLLAWTLRVLLDSK